MPTKSLKSKKSYITMDPNCAICHAPASMACDCEARALDTAIKQAEHNMMSSIYTDIRTWVRTHAQDYILEYFRLLTERRKNAHSADLDRITANAYYQYNSRPHPSHIAEAEAKLKRGIDEDWQASVQRYPEVLEYFYGLVELTLPSDAEASIKDPPLSALNGNRKPPRRVAAPTYSDYPPALTSSGYYDEIPSPGRRSKSRRSGSVRPPNSRRYSSVDYAQEYITSSRR